MQMKMRTTNDVYRVPASNICCELWIYTMECMYSVKPEMAILEYSRNVTSFDGGITGDPAGSIR